MRPGERPGGGAEEVAPLTLQQLADLYDCLSVEERDELLQCLLIAAPRGGEAMIEVLEQTLLCHEADESSNEHSEVDEKLGLKLVGQGD